MATAKRLEAELGDEQDNYIEEPLEDWALLPPPEDRLFVGIDGGFVRNCATVDRATSHFEIIIGKTHETGRASKRFAFVQTLDEKPRRRVFETLKSHGMLVTQDVTFLTDGADDVRQLPAKLNPNSEHILDWHHVTMKLTVLQQIAKGIAVKAQVAEALESLAAIKHKLWHGHVRKALKAIGDLRAECVDSIACDARYSRLVEMLTEFGTYIENNADFIPNYAERHRYGELISTAFAESAVNEIISKRMVKKQQMSWSKQGAHMLLQVRVKTLDKALRGKFESWYPGLAPPSSLYSKAALTC